jgi:hypothetical protein
MYLKLSVVSALVGASGCTLGMGPSTAATRPLLGQTMSNDDATMYRPTADQSGVPAGFVRVEQVSDNFARVFNWVSITSAAKKGSITPTVNGTTQDAVDLIALDLALTVRIPLPVGGISLGGGHVWSLEDAGDVKGFGVRASVAPIAQLSVDFAHSWVSGAYDDGMSPAMDLSGTHTSLGGTVLIWGYNMFRFGVAVAKVWTSADNYSGSGYTYTLVTTMY